jgi:microcompartment protein CcmL/EutN
LAIAKRIGAGQRLLREISAIHTAIERGVEVAGAAQHVKSLVIARPEPSVVAALSHLKGRPRQNRSRTTPT